MPRTLYDVDGNAIENIPEESEIEELKAAKAAKEAADARIQELEQDVNPNFKAMREAKRKSDERAAELEKQLAKAGLKDETREPVVHQDVEAIAERKAKEVLLRRHKEEILRSYGEKKDIVDRYYQKLSAGEEDIDEDKIEEIMQAAANAAGIGRSRPDPIRASMNSTGGPPRFEKAGEKDFSETDAGKSLAKMMGLKFPEIKK